MNKLFKFEFYKLFRKKSFYVCFILSVLSFVGLTVATRIISNALFGESSIVLPNAFETSLLTTLMGIFTVLFVSEDFNDHTMKSIVAKGYSRPTIFFVKYIVSTIAVLIMAAGILIGAVVTGLVLRTPIELTSPGIFTLLTQFVVLIALNTMNFTIAMLLRKSGSSIAIVILVPELITMVLQFLPGLIKGLPFNPSDYWIETLLGQAAKATDFGVLMKVFAIAVAYIAVIAIPGNVIFQRQDY